MANVGLDSADRHRAVFQQLGSAEPTTTAEAAAVLFMIRVSKGYLDNESRLDLNKLKSSTLDLMLQYIQEKRDTEAAFTKSISEQIYSSKYRFLYELVQNADDSLYYDACHASKLPFLRFTITPDTFIVETNEDGFRRANVRAVCATGRSSKKALAVDDHIGEKGFGFKSVFSVAEEVQVQSGIWSFRFQHRQGDDSLGMVTPLDAHAVILPPDVTTRITLRLSTSAISDYKSLLNAVASMPETTIFFLQRLRRIEIHVTDLNAKTSATTFEKTALGTPATHVQLRRYQRSGDGVTIDDSLYRCFIHHINNMPETEYRKGRKAARIELAFPVEPVTQQPKFSKLGQHVFAYLPLQRLQQIQFLIQSDFVTSANRETVVDNAWNDSIFKGVAKAFATAVENFTKDDDPLRYSWLDYLPIEISDDRWKTLCPLIIEELAGRPILETSRQRRLKEPSELLKLSEHMFYDGKPILEDLPDDVYLAPEYYVSRYFPKLGSLGVRLAGLPSMMRRLEADLLIKPLTSKVRTTKPHDPWHTAFASLFLTAWATKTSTIPIQERLKRLAIIPLKNRQQWAGAPGQSGGGLKNIYLSETNGIAIPDSLGLNLLDTHASSDPTRKALYMALGVEECPHDLVIERIKQKHSIFTERPTDIASHLRYLFCANEDPLEIKPWAWIPTKFGHVRHSKRLYFPSEDEHDLYQALTGVQPSKYRDVADFLDKSLLAMETNFTNHRGITWKDWLQLATGAQYYPPLLHCNAETFLMELSPALVVIRTHKPARFMDMLRAHWHDYEVGASRIESYLRAMPVRCMTATVEPAQYEALGNTYLPTVNVVDRALKLGLSPTKFHILFLPGWRLTTDKLDDDGYRRWRFLEEFGVRRQPDLDFYKCALRNIRLVTQDPNFEALKDIYASIAKLATADDHDNLCKFFSQDLLWVPGNKSWVDMNQCNWRGPDFLRYKSVLEPHYGDDPVLSRFFKGTLDVKDTSITDVMFELVNRRDASETVTSLAVAGKIYAFLCDHTAREEEWQDLRAEFGKKDLILGTNDMWHTLETCVWHTPFLLSGYQDLSSTYPQLELFFVKRLKVKKVTSSMLIKEISKMVAKKSPDYADVRKRLIDVGMMLAKTKLDKATNDALSELAESKFLPKRLAGGDTVLLGRHDAYAIRDHARYGSAFAEHGILLDFLVEEVQIMNVMFEHMGVKKHYLSSLVVEESTVENGAEEDDDLTQQLQAKAYALYCCAAKYKSIKALRGDRTLFETLSAVRVLKGNLATHLVIDNKDLNLGFKVRSDRSFVHHERSEGCLKIYVPQAPKQRQTCYQSQLPKLLADVMCVDASARHDISVIIESDLRALEDVLVEHDITVVSWIEQPVLDISDNEDSVTSSPRSQYMPDAANPGMRRRASTISSTGSMSPSASTLFDHAASSSMQSTSNLRVSRSSNQADQDRHNGALGEAFVFEKLSALNLTDFTRNNWRSTIRGELSRYPGYAGITNWTGRETADIVYKDCDGRLTRWLEENCTGGYPAGSSNRDFAEQPIEYYFEVKSTTGACESRFFLSTGQYKLMRDMKVQTGRLPTRIYVIMRVFNVLSDDKELKILVDPVRLEGIHVEFEVEGWTGRILRCAA